MTPRVADYAMVGDMRTGMLVHPNGSIDWWCAPRFDSASLFGRLLDERAGFWQIAPAAEMRSQRRYRGNSLVLETTFEHAGGAVLLTDCLHLDTRWPTIVRSVLGLRGTVAMTSSLQPRMSYGRVVPWTRRDGGAWAAVAAPDALLLRTEVELSGTNGNADAAFSLSAGRCVTFALHWHPAHFPPPPPIDAAAAVDASAQWWQAWAGGLHYDGPHSGAVIRSALILKGLTDRSTGAMVAALTTSLPEQLGGIRNWDYRYCWLRDASFGTLALNALGAAGELHAWCDWFFRTYAGAPDALDTMYGIAGERLTPEENLDHLAGFRGSRPVRAGNDAHEQFQLGIFGCVTAALVAAVKNGYPLDSGKWKLLQPLIGCLENAWPRAGNGMWELRGEHRHYVHSKAMASTAARDLAILAAPHDRVAARDAAALAQRIRSDVIARGFDPRRGTFTEYYGSHALDASVLLLPQFGFLPVDDPRMASTIETVAHALLVDGYVFRSSVDIVRRRERVETHEGAFAACGFWLVQIFARQGRRAAAAALYERLLRTANDVGNLSEEYDVFCGEAVGNTPQAFSHAAAIDAGIALGRSSER